MLGTVLALEGVGPARAGPRMGRARASVPFVGECDAGTHDGSIAASSALTVLISLMRFVVLLAASLVFATSSLVVLALLFLLVVLVLFLLLCNYGIDLLALITPTSIINRLALRRAATLLRRLTLLTRRAYHTCACSRSPRSAHS